ncbi:fumarylacetoacetate hydrolase [Mycolicibacterium madagascariense]|uniref:Fumarylacetoacetate hydrolase n=1 Tax=Mycolicibacterium madagascariense TaxID=212765 RepID=A0A7I7XID1_9MYCO|nr:fumarylacetoacetate hydrolase family protein [Mycolicibacterium madagascariense]MCV7010941.1 fumarylacetoacetate hydrolase family protein [Mycolicibacterium madagascariense]BBZ28934.1 fumarylacetoacetate hydrolase [Mycolicibacterium madagascariense]
MVTNLVRYRHEQRVGWGVLRGGLITPLREDYARTADLIEHGESDWRSASKEAGNLAWAEVEPLSPITTPCRVMCQGANYRQHAIESGMNPDDRAFNLFFDKTDASITGPHAPVVRPARVELLDYEIELALVMRQQVDTPTTITSENLHQYVFGVTIANDLSARDVQLPQGQFLKGKSYRGFCPIGPVLAVLEPDDIPLLDDLDLRLEVNGEPRQGDTTANMLYRPAETLTELTEFCDLSPGDVLLTGTPHGCVATSPPPLVRRLATALLPEDKLWASFIAMNRRKSYLTPGDVITASIRRADGALDLGTQRTIITAPEEGPSR